MEAGVLTFIGDEHDLDRIQLDTAPRAASRSFTSKTEAGHQTPDAAEAAAIIRSWLEHIHPPASPAKIDRRKHS
jgi:hypothetical protein